MLAQKPTVVTISNVIAVKIPGPTASQSNFGFLVRFGRRIWAMKHIAAKTFRAHNCRAPPVSQRPSWIIATVVVFAIAMRREEIVVLFGVIMKENPDLP